MFSCVAHSFGLSASIGEVSIYIVPADMADEDQQYANDVAAVKKWWTDSRWRYTKRPYTAEDVVAKRGNLKIEYPSNVQSKKLWKLMESRFQVQDLCEAGEDQTDEW